VKLNPTEEPLTLTRGADTGASVEVSDGHGNVLLKSAVVAEQVEVHVPTVVLPAPATTLMDEGFSVMEILLAADVAGVIRQEIVMVPTCSTVPCVRMDEVVAETGPEH